MTKSSWQAILGMGGLSAVAGVALIQLSDQLRLRSIHDATSDLLGWVAGTTAVAVLCVVAWGPLRYHMTGPVTPWVPAAVVILGTPLSVAVMDVGGPPWFNSDVVGAIMILSIASAAHLMSATGVVSGAHARRLGLTAGHVVAGTLSLSIIVLITWAILFLE